jgi:hypothetical protein
MKTGPLCVKAHGTRRKGKECQTAFFRLALFVKGLAEEFNEW